MLQLFSLIQRAAICSIAVTAFTLPAFSLQECKGFNPGEPGDIIRREADETRNRYLAFNRTEPRQQCSVNTLKSLQEMHAAWKRLVDFQNKHVGSSDCPATGNNAVTLRNHEISLKFARDNLATCQAVMGIDPRAASSPTNRTGASAPTPYPIDCKKRPIDANVAWYYSCNPPTESDELRRAAYRHPITPQELYGKAYATCRSRPVEQQAACIPEAKKTVLLTEDAAIRTRCGALSNEQQVHCVESYYLFGPNAGSVLNTRAYVQREIDYQNRVEAALRQRYFETEDELARLGTEHPRYREVWNRSYALIIAQNGTGPMPVEVQQLAQTVSLQPFTTPQELFDRVVRASVDVALEANPWLQEDEQKQCASAAYKAAWSVMSGLTPPRPPSFCGPMISDTLAQLAYQAANQFSTPPPPEEDLLKHYLGLHYANTKGKNDGSLDAPFEAQGLTPGTDAPR